jgi:hypothetical protein
MPAFATGWMKFVLFRTVVCDILIMGVYWNAHEPAGIPAMGVNK